MSEAHSHVAWCFDEIVTIELTASMEFHVNRTEVLRGALKENERYHRAMR